VTPLCFSQMAATQNLGVLMRVALTNSVRCKPAALVDDTRVAPAVPVSAAVLVTAQLVLQ
jgi:hypothetical protein